MRMEMKKKHKQKTATEIAERRAASKKRRNIWKDETGGSLLELEDTNTVAVVGINEVSFPFQALPTKAKFVVKRYQYEKKHYTDVDQEEEDDSDSEGDHCYYSTPQKGKLFLNDFIEDGSGVSINDFISNANLTLKTLHSTNINEIIYGELLALCQSNHQQALELIEAGQNSEESIDQLLQLIDQLNATLIS